MHLLLDELVREKKVHAVSKVERKKISESDVGRIADRIRSIRPQARGSIVASGGKTLPLSGSKKLNLSNTPVLLVEKEEVPVYVFPCRVGENYYDVMEGLRFLREHLPEIVDLPAGSEESIVSLIIQHPELLEKGLKLKSSEIETSTGRGDLLFRDGAGRLLLLEVEREATDQAVGQILRLCAGYEGINELGIGEMRAGIACFRINEHVLAAAKRAKIEVWKIKDGKSEYFPV